MVLFHAHLVIADTTKAYDAILHNTSTDEGGISIEAPSFDGALVDLENICKEILAAHVQQFIDDDVKLFPLHCKVEYSLMAISKVFEQIINEELFDKLKSAKEDNRPKLNEESLKNDIEYGINLLRSVYSGPDNKAWITNPPIVWQYYIMQKHFGIPVPEELRTQMNNLQK
jgi:hypothetical protein